jgi:myo-inositol-1(or 4)-monophosphatase
MNVKQLHVTAQPIIQEAGAILVSYFGKKDLAIRSKQYKGIVTEADIASETFLKEKLGALLPQASFFAEESGPTGDTSSGYCWVIDPLDGTTNFAHRLPYFCISVALTYQNKPVWGCVYQPLLDEFFHAAKDEGAYLNGKPIFVSHEKQLAKSLIVIGLPYRKNKLYRELLTGLNRLAPITYAIRHMGAAALDLAYLADGRMDGIFFEGLEWWDVAAGMLLIKEAGGKVTDFEGKEIGPTYISCVAATPELYTHLIPLLQEIKEN